MNARETRISAAMVAVIAVQMVCAAFYLSDVIFDGMMETRAELLAGDFLFELVACVALIAAVIFETRFLMELLRRKAHLERQLNLAAGAFQDVMLDHFRHWCLTPSEQDVALFTIKGMSIAEIACLRGSAEGTVKSHLNAIYRKAGVAGRGGLQSLLIEDLMSLPAVGNGAADHP